MVAPTNKSAETLFSLPICVIQFYTHNKTPTVICRGVFLLFDKLEFINQFYI